MTPDLEDYGPIILAAVADYQNNSARSQQSTARILGMSEMGGCREYIRATIAGDVKAPPPDLKWAAFLGTVIGDGIENILGEMGFVTQEDAVLRLPTTGITVRGHLDARGPNVIIDLKSKDGLAEIRREGPSFKEKSQISGYLIAKLQEGIVDENGVGKLVYYDRSGKDKTTHEWTVDVPQAYLILEAVEERLIQVQEDLAAARHSPRDEPESWCYAIGCPFYQQCWSGYEPTEAITSERELDAVRRLIEARDLEKEAKSLREAAREDLKGVEGVTPDGTVVQWKIAENQYGGLSETLTVRKAK